MTIKAPKRTQSYPLGNDSVVLRTMTIKGTVRRKMTKVNTLLVPVLLLSFVVGTWLVVRKSATLYSLI